MYQRFLEGMWRHDQKGAFFVWRIRKTVSLTVKIKEKQSNKETLTDIVCVHVGIEPTPYFPKVKNVRTERTQRDETGTTNAF